MLKTETNVLTSIIVVESFVANNLKIDI